MANISAKRRFRLATTLSKDDLASSTFHKSSSLTSAHVDMQGLISKINRSTVTIQVLCSWCSKSMIRSMLRKNPEHWPTVGWFANLTAVSCSFMNSRNPANYNHY
ncbi:hypothetical protein BDL97_18G088700 [Sphagnum fallax]|nr:hypothetical protein BDL97_18G088700 [Sphagnum fallax]